MKKMFITLALSTFMLGAATTEASNRMLPDTNMISSQTELVVLGEGDNVMPVHVSKNPSLYNRQQIASGTIEASFDAKTNTVHIARNGRTTKSTKIYSLTEAMSDLGEIGNGDYIPQTGEYIGYNEKALAELGEIGNGDYVL